MVKPSMPQSKVEGRVLGEGGVSRTREKTRGGDGKQEERNWSGFGVRGVVKGGTKYPDVARGAGAPETK
ncbi:hypothetical protein M0802_006216 [Mischocyttarus mexicanus]|nr:hypothetical protein M0802_006216 [Mischocyttarus mexicanus]